MLNVGTLTGYIVTAGDLRSEIGIGIDCLAAGEIALVFYGIITKTGCFIELELINTAGPGTVAHAQVAVFIIEYAGINCVRPVFTPLFGICLVIFGRKCIEVSVYELQICVLIGKRSSCFRKSGVDNGTLIDIGAFDTVRR